MHPSHVAVLRWSVLRASWTGPRISTCSLEEAVWVQMAHFLLDSTASLEEDDTWITKARYCPDSQNESTFEDERVEQIGLLFTWRAVSICFPTKVLNRLWRKFFFFSTSDDNRQNLRPLCFVTASLACRHARGNKTTVFLCFVKNSIRASNWFGHVVFSVQMSTHYVWLLIVRGMDYTWYKIWNES